MNTPLQPALAQPSAHYDSGTRSVPAPELKADKDVPPTRLQKLMAIQSAWLARHNAQKTEES